MRRLEFKKHFLKHGLGAGLTAQQLANAEFFLNAPIKIGPKRGSKTVSGATTSQIHTAEVVKPKVKPVVTNPKTITRPEAKAHRHHISKSAKSRPTAMDHDFAKNKVNQLYNLVDQYGETYLTHLIDPDCNQPSAFALNKERKLFYWLFGSKPSEQEAVAKLIARDLDFSDNAATQVTNGLIKYFHGLAIFLDARRSSIKQTPDLLAKYIKYGVHEVYNLIRSISKKVTIRMHTEIDPEGYLFPIQSIITNTFNTAKHKLASIEF